MYDIGWAVNEMKDARRVRRAGWNGKGMWLALVADWVGRIGGGPEKIGAPKDWQGPLPFIVMYTADKHTVPWLCSQTDLLATDWETAEIVE
jgi:hypothetical protein